MKCQYAAVLKSSTALHFVFQCNSNVVITFEYEFKCLLQRSNSIRNVIKCYVVYAFM